MIRPTRALMKRIAFTFGAIAAIVSTSFAAAEKPAAPAAPPHATQTATFAGGCFWSMNAIFERLKGVDHVTAGFSGGTVARPSYERVCTGTTGHAESVQITYDPTVISYRDLLNVFFTLHDPTSVNRQGADVGTQYRSAIFYHSPAQHDTVLQTIAELEKRHAYASKIVTELMPYQQFYPAEDYHQGYYDKNSSLPYCQIVIAPKLSKLRKHFPEMVKRAM